MAKQYRTALIIEGDAKGGIRAIKATDDELTKLNRRFDSGGKKAKQFARDVDETGRDLEFLRSTALGVGAALAGAFAAGNLAGQAQMIQQTEALARSLNVSTQTLQQWQYAGQQVGLEADKVGDIFKDVSDKIGDFAATGGGEAKDLFENLNLNIRELQGLTPDQQILKIAAAVNQLEDPSQRTFYFESLADEMVRLQPLLANGAQGLRQAAAEADAIGVAMSEIEIRNAMEAAHAMDQLQGVAQGLSNTLIADLGPGLANTAQGLIDWIDMLGGADEALEDLIGLVAMFGGVILARRFRDQLATAGTAGLSMGRNIATGLYAATGAAGGLNRALVITQGRIAATAAAGRALRGTMALLGGPAGVAILAAGAIYTFRDELGLTVPELEASSEAVATLTGRLDDLNQASAELRLTTLIGKLADLKAQAEVTGDAYLDVGRDEPINGGGFLGVDVSAQVEQFREISEATSDSRQEMVNVEAAIGLVEERLQELQAQGERTVPTIKDLADATKEAEKAQREYEQSMGSLLDTLYPLQASQREYAEQKALLIEIALRENKGNAWLEESMRRLDMEYRSATDAAEAYGFTGERAMGRVADAANPMAIAIERSVERMDDAFVDSWRGLIDGSENAFDAFKDIALDTLAEVIHAFTTRRITATLGMSLAGTGSAMASGAGGGIGLGDVASIGSSLFGGGLQTATSAWHAMMGTGSTYGGLFGSELVATGNGGFLSGLESLGASGLGNLALGVGGGLAGGYLGTMAGESLFGKQANSNYGAMAGAALGQVLIPIPGLGAAIGGALGGALDAAFGSGREYGFRFTQTSYDPGAIGKDLGYDTSPGDGTPWYSSGNYANGDLGRGRTTAFGSYGFLSKEVVEPSDMIDFLDSLEQIDNTLAAFMDADQIERIKSSLDGYYYKGDSMRDVMRARLNVIIDQSNSAFESAIERMGGGIQAQVQALANGLQVESVGAEMASAVADAMNSQFREALANGSDLGAATQSILASAQAVELLATSADRLNLRFDETVAGALGAAGGLAAMVGALQSLASLQEQYYQAFVSDEERLAYLTEDLSEQFDAIGLALPDTAEGFRDLVEAQNLMTEAGREQYAALLALVPGMDQYLNAMEQQGAELERQRQQIGNWLDDMLLSDQSTLDPSERLQESQTQYAQLQVLAEAGNAEAIGQLGSAAQSYLAEVAGYYGQGSSNYASIFDDIIEFAQGLAAPHGSHAAGLGSVPFDGYRAELHQGETVLPAPIAQLYRESAPGNNGNAELLQRVDALIRSNEQLRAEVAQLRSERGRDAERAAGQRSDQLREAQKINRNTRTKAPTL